MVDIKRTVSADSITEPKDIISLKKELSRKGYYKEPDYGITPYADKELFSAIRSYQKDKNLKVDGIVRPDGETINSLNNNQPDARSPTTWCPKCGGAHGGSKGDLCPSCDAKS